MPKKKLQFYLYVLPTVTAILSSGALAAALLSSSGMIGLLEWMPEYRRRFFLIPLAGIAPVVFFVIGRIASRAGKNRLSVLVGSGGAILATVVTAAALGGGIWLYCLTHTLSVKMPALNTLNAEGNPPLLRLTFSSDPHIGSPNSNTDATERILRAVNGGGYDAFFILGDIAEMGAPGDDFDEAAALFSRFMTKVPIVTLMGNHDSLVGGEWRYRKIFNPDLWFRIDSGKVHVIALNLLWGAESLNRAQREWLTRTLKSIPEPDTVIVLSHCFIRSSGSINAETGKKWFDNESLIERLAPILEENGVDLVISGHNHFMEYIERPSEDGEGTGYAIIGAMGGTLDPSRTHISEGSRWYTGAEYGFLDLDLRGERAILTFRDENGNPLRVIQR